jgi:heterodisulfide reductase subunit A
VKVSGFAGKFEVKVLKNPRFIEVEKCTGCGVCTEKCPVKVPNEFDVSMSARKAIYVPFPQSVPHVSIIDKNHCLFLKKGICRICEKFCQANAINFNQKPEEITLNVSCIIVSTGFELYDPTPISEYGYKQHKNVITALEFERLISASGPTAGQLRRPSDGKIPERIVFVQCVGSRDEKNNPYCCSVCCMFATKEAMLIKEHYPQSEVYILYTDLRRSGKGGQEYTNRAKEEYKINYIRSRPSEIIEDPETKNLKVLYNDGNKVKSLEAELVVLCNTLTPTKEAKKLSEILGIEIDEYGFYKAKDPLQAPVDTNVPGIFVCGFCKEPSNITESVFQASAAASRALELLKGV